MKRPHSLETMRQRPQEIEEQQFNPVQSHNKKEKQNFFQKSNGFQFPPKLHDLIAEIDSVMNKFSKSKPAPQLPNRIPLVDLNLYTLADVNIPSEEPAVHSRVYKPKRHDFCEDPINFQSTNASSKKGGSLKALENYELSSKRQKKLARIEKLIVNNTKCLNEKLVQTITKQEKEFKPEREFFIKNLMTFTGLLYSGTNEENGDDLEKLAQKMRCQERVIIDIGQTGMNLTFLLEGASFLVEEKAEVLKKKNKNRTEILNKLKNSPPSTIFK